MESGLTVIMAPSGRAVREATDRLVGQLGRRCARVARLLPNARLASLTQRRLADAGLPTLGIDVATLDAWALGRWEVFGDGRVAVRPEQRRAMALRALALTPTRLLNAGARGLVGCVEAAVRKAAGLAEFDSPDTAPLAASAARSASSSRSAGPTSGCLPTTASSSRARRRPFCPASWRGGNGRTSCLRTPRRSRARSAPCFSRRRGGRGSRSWCARAESDVRDDGPAPRPVPAPPAHALPARAPSTPATRLPKMASAHSPACARSRGSLSRGSALPRRTAPRAPRSALLARAVFQPSCDRQVPATGAVRFVMPSGGYAQPEALAQQIALLHEQDGIACRQIVVTCKDPLKTAEGLAERLATRGMTPRAGVGAPSPHARGERTDRTCASRMPGAAGRRPRRDHARVRQRPRPQPPARHPGARPPAPRSALAPAQAHRHPRHARGPLRGIPDRTQRRRRHLRG